MNKKIKYTIILLGVLSIIIIGLNIKERKIEDTKTNEQQSEVIQEDPQTEADSTSQPAGEIPDQTVVQQIKKEQLEAIEGGSSGVAGMIVPVLFFPEATLFTTDEGKVAKISTSGFDSELLNMADLAIEEGVFPKLKLIANGSFEIDGQDSFLYIEELTPELYTLDGQGKEQPLSTDTQTQLLATINSEILNIPVITPEDSLKIPVEVKVSGSGGFTIASTEDAENFYFMFETD